MSQASLLDYLDSLPTPRGATFIPELDAERLGKQAADVWELMKDGQSRTLREISEATGHPEASVSARLRDLDNWHGWRKERTRSGGTHFYRLTKQPPTRR